MTNEKFPKKKFPKMKLPQQSQPDSSFWSPWEIFFFGVYYAALNWWRMGDKRKAILFLIIFTFLELVYEWLAVDRLVTETDFELGKILLVVKLLGRVAFQILLMELMRVDIRKFKELGKTPVPTKWTIVFRFLIAMLIPVLAINLMFYFVPRIYGVCAFPRFQNLVYRLQIANRAGPEKVLINQNDFGCEWLWFSESTQIKNTQGVLQTYQYDLYGVYRDPGREEGTRMSMYQTVYLLDEPVTKEQFEEFLARNNIGPSLAVLSNWHLLDIPTHGASVEWSEAHCEEETVKLQDCAAYLVNQTMIVRLLFKGDAGYDRYINVSIQKVAERMLEYAKSP